MTAEPMCRKIAGGRQPPQQHCRASAPACLSAGRNVLPYKFFYSDRRDYRTERWCLGNRGREFVRVVPKICDGTAPVPPSNLDGVALHLVIKGRALNAEQLGGFLLVTVCLGQRLKNRLSLHVIETGHAAAAHRSRTRL